MNSTSNIVLLDLFGFKPHLYFKNYKHSSTKCGLILSFLLVLFTIFCLFYFGQDLYYKHNPSLIYSESLITFPSAHIIDPEYNPILLELNNPVGDEFYTDRKYIKAIVSQIFLTKETAQKPKLSITDYEMEICTENHFKNVKNKLSKEWFINRNLHDYFCIPTNIKNLTMEGAFDQNVYKAIRFSFFICSNDTNNSCENREIIKTKMKSGFFGVYFVDQIIDPGEYENFVQLNPNEIFSNWDISAAKELSIFFKKNNIITDDGFFFENLNEFSLINYESEQNFQFIEEKNDFLVIYLRMSHKETHYRRKYQKIQNLLAQIGGFINCFWIIAFILNYLTSHLYFIRDIVKDVFSILELNSNDINTLRKKKTNNSTIATTKNAKIFQLQNSIENENNNKTNFKDLSENILKESNDINLENLKSMRKRKKSNNSKIMLLHLYFMDIFHYYTGLFSNPIREQKKAIIKKGIHIIKENLDVKCIIRKFFEIEKLKQIVLNEKQLELFNNMGKPQLELKITKDKINVRTNVLTLRKSTFNKIKFDKNNPMNC